MISIIYSNLKCHERADMSLNDIVLQLNNIAWGWPLLIFIVGAAIVCTIALVFVQFRYFITMWNLVFFPKTSKTDTKEDMTPFQAFLNALSASVGNGSIAGVATAVYAGGPGAAFWIVVLGFLGMALRYSEVYLSSLFATHSAGGNALGGPMIYLSRVPGGSFLPYFYAFLCFMLALASGNAMQANSMREGLVRIMPFMPKLVIACILLAFIMYVMFGGAKRIIAVSDKIVPVKVGLFFSTCFIVLLYHYNALIPALYTIWQGAFNPAALGGAALGLTMQNAMRFGIARGANASEAGLGTAGILFGGSSAERPVENGIMSMLSAFISANLVCFSIAWMIVASGVWNSGETGLCLTIAAYNTVFGTMGGWIVTFLAISFGMGVLVAYAYISRACWIFLTGGKFMNVFTAIFCAVTFLGAMAKVDVVWNSTDLVNAGLLASNLWGILWLLPLLRKGLANYQNKEKVY